MQLNDLVGFKLVGLDETGFTIQKGDVSLFVRFDRSDGDCCGFTELETKLLVKEGVEPVITAIECEDVPCEYDGVKVDGEKVVVRFFGMDKLIAEVEALASSGSGWCYGACVGVVCDAIGLKECIASW